MIGRKQNNDHVIFVFDQRRLPFFTYNVTHRFYTLVLYLSTTLRPTLYRGLVSNYLRKLLFILLLVFFFLHILTSLDVHFTLLNVHAAVCTCRARIFMR